VHNDDARGLGDNGNVGGGGGGGHFRFFCAMIGITLLWLLVAGGRK
jgi:hypothetical protein